MFFTRILGLGLGLGHVFAQALAASFDSFDTLDSLDIDPAISNGTCYGSSENTLDDGFLPCGNNALGVQSCCWHGDFCLVGAACFGIHDNSYVTYLAGCTDADYHHPRCPAKGSKDAWVGLEYCDDVSGDWEACEQPDHPTTIAPAGPCSCPAATASRTIGEFAVGSSLSATASLPFTLGGTLSWVSPFGPVTMVTALSMPGMTASGTLTTTVIWRTTTAPDRVSSVGGADPLSLTTLTSLSTATVPVLPSVSFDLSLTGEPVSATAPAGSSTGTSFPAGGTSTAASTAPSSSPPSHKSHILGTGIGVGTALVLLLILAATLLVRRKRTKQATTVTEVPDDAESASKTTPSTAVPPTEATCNETTPMTPASELEALPARPWSLRSELEAHGGSASQSVRSSTAVTATPTWKMISELEG